MFYLEGNSSFRTWNFFLGIIKWWRHKFRMSVSQKLLGTLNEMCIWIFKLYIMTSKDVAKNFNLDILETLSLYDLSIYVSCFIR